MKSEAARTLAVRRVTQDNQGKRTAGVDGIKSVAPAERLIMVKCLRHHKTIKPKPTRRVCYGYVDTWRSQCVLHQPLLCRQIGNLST
jgi:N-terminal domain of reverse transcriptase